MDNKTRIENHNEMISDNNTSIDTLIEAINNLPEAGGGGSSGEIVSSGLVIDGASLIMSQNFVDNTTYILYTFDETYSLTNQVQFQLQNDQAEGSFNLDSETSVTYMAFCEFFGSGSDLFDVFSLSFEGANIPAFICLKKVS